MLLDITEDYVPFSNKTHEEVDFNVSYTDIVFGIPESFGGELVSKNNYTDTAQDLDAFAY